MQLVDQSATAARHFARKRAIIGRVTDCRIPDIVGENRGYIRWIKKRYTRSHCSSSIEQIVSYPALLLIFSYIRMRQLEKPFSNLQSLFRRNFASFDKCQ